ncbi:MAG: hypothetical protein HYU68_12645 [Bacteroidetes bacterium]|nr:hypothetical protein [Bacteroidota bacterium]
MSIRLFILGFLICLTNVKLLAQCAMCKAVVESDAGLAKGVNDGILYLMAIPYILLIVIGYFVYNHYKKTKTNV